MLNNFSHRIPFYFSLGFLFFAIGVFFSSKLYKFLPKFELNKFQKMEFHLPFKLEKAFQLAILTFLTINLFLIGYLFWKEGVPLFQEEIEKARVQIALGHNWLLVRSLRIFLPILLLITFLYMLKTKKFFSKFIFAFLLFLLLLIYTFYGYKGYFLSYVFFPLVISYSCVKKVKIRNVLFLFFLSVLTVFIILSVLLKTLNPLVMTQFLFSRLTIGQAEGVNYIMNELIPEMGFFRGETFKKDILGMLAKLGLTQEKIFNFNAFLFEKIHGKNPLGMQVASTLFGEFYANFGLIGGILAMFLSGLITQTLYISGLRSSKDIFFFPLIIFFQLIFLQITIAGHTLISVLDIGFSSLFTLFLVILFYIFYSFPQGKVIFLKKAK